MIRAKLFVLVFTFAIVNSVFSQDEFKFKDPNKRAVTLNFKSLNNLIILSATLNGKLINFLVDTGVNKTKVFGNVKDSTFLETTEFIQLRSLGSAEPVKAYKSTENTIDFGPIYGNNQEVYYITDPRFDLSSKLGLNVQGIIGYELFKNFIIRLNYTRKNLRFYQHEKFNRKLNTFDEIDFRLIRKKPNINLSAKLLDGTQKDLVFLVDTGSSDAFWIFEGKNITAPKESFVDFVGYGLEQVVKGKRSKAKTISVGQYDLKKPRVAYIDSTSAELFTADLYKNGIMGSEVLKRFVWFFNYKERKLYFKPNGQFNSNFNYDRSGLILTYAGEEIKTVKKKIFATFDEKPNYGFGSDDSKTFEIRYEKYQILQVAYIRPDSPASKVDIRKGDRILRFDGKPVERMNLKEINDLLSGDEGEKVIIQLKRGKLILKRKIYLSSRLN
ncbi:retropepsin-like aspartic protease [Psychroflexus tropicus]|uniref:retropepsin-like aspartic protease n=1 Tax=Psychroflexus tropicus TaxID=197345 RepID=UPI0003809DC5|nr:aspartyl protease family protein [Psychroflexus tropicus]